MNSEIIRASSGELARSQQPTVLDVIRELAVDERVSVERLSGLMALQERSEAREAEREFTREFAALQMELPRVKKNGTINMGGKGSMPFAKWEDVDSVIRPRLAKRGFTLSFSSEPVQGGVLMVCTLAHVNGHKRESRMQLPPDDGAGRNKLQAIGSSRSYGKRYLALDILNIVTEGQDDDGKTAEPISTEQADQIRDVLTEMGTAPSDGRFLKWLKDRWGFDSLNRIQREYFDEVMRGLDEKRRARQ